jgi:hypothetical protein
MENLLRITDARFSWLRNDSLMIRSDWFACPHDDVNMVIFAEAARRLGQGKRPSAKLRGPQGTGETAGRADTKGPRWPAGELLHRPQSSRLFIAPATGRWLDIFVDRD